MSMMGGYSPALMFGGSGTPASVGPNVTTEHVNKAVADAQGDKTTVHISVAVVVLAVIVLSVGRGYLRNARIA